MRQTGVLYPSLVVGTAVWLALSVGLGVCAVSAQTVRTDGVNARPSASAQTTGVAALRPVPQADRVLTKAGNAMTALRGHVPAWAQPSNLSATPVDSAAPLRVILLLRRSPAAEAAFEQLLADQQTPGSAVYHQAVTPEQVGELYGPTMHDIQAVESWARSEGLTVGSLSPTHTTLELSGATSAVESALRVHLSNYNTARGLRQAPDAEPQLPAQLAPVVAAIGGLVAEDAQPQFTGSKGNHFITPADFATIYDVTPVYNAGNTGAAVGSKAQHVAILGDSDAKLSEVQAYFAGIGSYQPSYNTFFADGTDPGYTMGEGEAELDLERVLGTAPGTTVDFVVGNTIYDAASYAVNTLKDPIVTVSFGTCEANLTPAEQTFWTNVWMMAAANMTSVFVSGGDAGADACDMHDMQADAQQKRAVNGFASTMYNVAVGGTEFNDTANPTQYWSTTNDPSTKASALGYIPESAWNDPVDTTANTTTPYLVRAGGGGASQYVTKPSWQVGPGVPNDGHRDMPDVAFSASDVNDQYYVCQRDDNCTVASQSIPGTFVAYGSGGTSAAAPSMAAIGALLNTAAGAPQGNLNPIIYRLANSAVASQIFHDVTLASSGFTSCDLTTPSKCNNSTPGMNSLQGGQQGYAVGPGYDQATGWGSLDVANFIKAAVQPATSLGISPSATAVSTSQTITVAATLTAASQSLAAPTGAVQFYVNGTASGSPVMLSNGAATSAAIGFPSAATYMITATYSGDALYLPSTSAASTILVSAQPPSFTLVASPSSLSFTSGATTGNSSTVTISAANDYAGSVALTCAISTGMAANQPTCAVSPSTATLALNGSGSAVVTITSTTAHALLVKAAPGDRPELVIAAGASLLAALCTLGFARRRRWLPTLMIAVLLAGTLITINGCSGGNTPLQSSAGTYTVTVTGTGTGSGALSPSTASTTFTVIVH